MTLEGKIDVTQEGGITWTTIDLDLPLRNLVSDLEFEHDPNYNKDNVVIDDSPYPEVRSAVANTDDPSIPVNTLRAWCIGIIWAILLPGLNQYLVFRYPSVIISNTVAQLTSYPMGLLWARFAPRVKVFGLSLNPGPFNVKEHVLITIMATVGYQSAYATDIIAVQQVYYHQDLPFSYQWLLVMSTQLIGFSIGGIARRFLVNPPSMIWPSNLINCALFNTLHSRKYSGIGERGGISRERFFVYAFLASGLWYLVPGYLFTALSYFSWVCWIAPNNIVVNQLFGYLSGLGMSTITFDWAQIAFIGSPLATPWWATANVAAGFLLFFWFLTPVLYYTNTWYAKYMPMASLTSFDNTGKEYNVTRILTPEATLDVASYEAYSPLFLSTTFAVSYGLSFATISATLTHIMLYYRKPIWQQARRSFGAYQHPDIHSRLMSAYVQVPDWWYAIIFLFALVFGILSFEIWHTQMPVWAFLIALILGFIYTIPIGIIQAVSNQQVGLHVITELIIGYALPGRPVAMMLFKTWGYMSMVQALQFVSDLKLGHYMKIPPRPMFWAQVTATVIAATVQLGVQSWMFAHIQDICKPYQPDGFICPHLQVFGTASIIWGVIGPARQFSWGKIYHGLLYFFPIGIAAPAIAYVIQRRWPKSIVKYVNFPIIFNGTAYIPPASGVNYISWAIVGFIFNYLIRRRNSGWWTKYNYVLSAALDAGVAVSGVLIFFCLRYPMDRGSGDSAVGRWWGNTVFRNTADGAAKPFYEVTNTKFGPGT